MHHDVGVIDDDPLAHRVTIDGSRRHLVIHLQPLLDLSGDGLEVGLRGPAANHKKIGETRNPAQIEGNEVFRLFVGGQRGAARGQFFSTQDERSSR
jgi:hypothetical protein